ncbi:MAG: zinc finger Ran-binding domain-containing protein [Firmicutes bacterium]|nr:zinc finger Ran-binding domain-containing protein [Bacillota bacterium]
MIDAKTENKNENFLLLDAVNNFIDGKLDMFTFMGKLESFRTELIELQNETNQTVDRLCINKALADVTTLDVEMIAQAFDSYLETFDLLKEFVMKNDRNNVICMAGRIEQCSSALDSVLSAFAEKAMILRGPTKFPKLNLILDCLKPIEYKSEGYEKLEAAVQTEKEGFNRNIGYLERKAQTDDSPEITSLLEIYRDAIIVLDAVTEASKQKNNDLLRQEIAKLDEFYIRANGFNLELLAKFFMSSHTFIPEANCLIQASIDFRSGRIIENVMLSAFDIFREKLAAMEEQVYSFINDDNSQTDTSWKDYFNYDEREEMMRLANQMADAIEPVKDSLLLYEQFLDTRNPDVLEQADAVLRESLKALEVPSRLMAEAGDRVGRVNCIKCGTSNPRERKTCSQCSAILLEGGL